MVLEKKQVIHNQAFVCDTDRKQRLYFHCLLEVYNIKYSKVELKFDLEKGPRKCLRQINDVFLDQCVTMNLHCHCKLPLVPDEHNYVNAPSSCIKGHGTARPCAQEVTHRN